MFTVPCQNLQCRRFDETARGHSLDAHCSGVPAALRFFKIGSAPYVMTHLLGGGLVPARRMAASVSLATVAGPLSIGFGKYRSRPNRQGWCPGLRCHHSRCYQTPQRCQPATGLACVWTIAAPLLDMDVENNTSTQ